MTLKLYRLLSTSIIFAIRLFGSFPACLTFLKKQKIPAKDFPSACFTVCLNYASGCDSLSVPLQVELVYYIFGRHKFPGAITANLERFVRRFNEVQHWVLTELCLCEDLMKRAMLLKKFIKIASV